MITTRTKHGSFSPALDWGHRLALGLVAYVPMIPLARMDLARPAATTTRSVPWPFVAGPHGMALSGGYVTTPAAVPAPTAECYMVAFRTTSTASSGMLGFNTIASNTGLQYNPASSGQLMFMRRSNNWSYWLTPAGLRDGNWHVVVVQVPGGATADILSATCTIDGVRYTIGGSASSGAPLVADSLIVGASSVGTFPGQILAAAAWRRTLSQDEVAAVSADPFCLLRRRTAVSLLARTEIPVVGYRLYLGKRSPLNIDWTTPIQTAFTGSTSAAIAGLALDRDTEYFIGIRAVSTAGRESSSVERICRVVITAAGVLYGSAPNALATATIAPGPAGTMMLTYRYQSRDQAAAPATLEVAQLVAGEWDWATPIDTFSLAGTTAGTVALSPTWSHGEVVCLAVRAVAADGTPGPVTELPVAIADAVAPADLGWLNGSCEDL